MKTTTPTMSTTPTPPAKPEFLLLLRNTQLEKRLSLPEMEEAMQRLNGWLDRWKARGAIKGGQPLGDEGRILTGAKRAVADGPFAESKEAVGGYILVQAGDFDEAMEIASEWPLLDYDGVVEVRPVLPQCATMRLVNERQANPGA